MDHTWLEEAAELERKAKALRRKESEFWSQVDVRRDEVLSRLQVSDTWRRILEAYSCHTEEDERALCEYLTSERQVAFYRRQASDTSAVS